MQELPLLIGWAGIMNILIRISSSTHQSRYYKLYHKRAKLSHQTESSSRVTTTAPHRPTDRPTRRMEDTLRARVEFRCLTTDPAGEAVDPFVAYSAEALRAAVKSALPADSLVEDVARTTGRNGQPALLVSASADMASLQEVRGAVLAGEFGAALTRTLAATAARMDPAKLVSGAYVRIGGLQMRPQLNGAQAVLLTFDETAGRWAVDSGGTPLKVRPTNLFAPDLVAIADATQFAEEHERQLLSLLTLTPHQQQKLEECAASDDIHLRAPAGAGKTFVALHRLHAHLSSGADGPVLYVARNRPLALFCVGWLARRLPPSRLGEALRSLHVLYEPLHDGPRALTVRSNALVPMRTKRCAEYALVVVDEAHHVYCSTAARTLVEQFVGPATGRLLLSDVSQSYGTHIEYPPAMREVLLNEVIRCSKRIVAGAMAFQLGGEEKLLTKCHHESTGPPLKAFLFDVPSTQRAVQGGAQGGADCGPSADLGPEAYAAYADQTLRALEHVMATFPGLRLHRRLAIVVPDEEFRLRLRTALRVTLAARFPTWQPRLVTASASVADVSDVAGCTEHGGVGAGGVTGNDEGEGGDDDGGDDGGDDDGDGGEGEGRDVIILESVGLMDGLEQLIVLAVGLDSVIRDAADLQAGGTMGGGEEDGRERETRSKLYRAVTRAQLMVVVVNEYLQGGWLEFLGHVRLSSDQGFDSQAELNRTEAFAADGVVLCQVSDAISSAAADAGVCLTEPALAALTTSVASSHERGAQLGAAAQEALCGWRRLTDQVRPIPAPPLLSHTLLPLRPEYTIKSCTRKHSQDEAPQVYTCREVSP